MTACRALRQEADLAYSQLSRIARDVPEGLAWAQVPLAPGAYLNTNGTILGVVQHIAVCKFMYGSTGFRDTELRWSTCFDQLEKLGTSWEANLAHLDEAHNYWLSTWDGLADEDLDAEYTHFRGVQWPGWKVIATVTQHDTYHVGQIELLASVLTPTLIPPDLRLDDERRAVRDLPGW